MGQNRPKWDFPQKSGKSQLFVDFFHSLWNFAIIRWEPPGNTPGQPQTTHKPPWGASGGLRRSKWAKIGQNRDFSTKKWKISTFCGFFPYFMEFCYNTLGTTWDHTGAAPDHP